MTEITCVADMGDAPARYRIERNGVLIDGRALQNQSQELGRRILQLEQEAYEIAGQPFNLASPKQIGEINMPPGTHSHKVRVVGDIMIVNRETNFEEPGVSPDFKRGLGVYDISNPRKPRELALWEAWRLKEAGARILTTGVGMDSLGFGDVRMRLVVKVLGGSARREQLLRRVVHDVAVLGVKDGHRTHALGETHPFDERSVIHHESARVRHEELPRDGAMAFREACQFGERACFRGGDRHHRMQREVDHTLRSSEFSTTFEALGDRRIRLCLHEVDDRRAVDAVAGTGRPVAGRSAEQVAARVGGEAAHRQQHDPAPDRPAHRRPVGLC